MLFSTSDESERNLKQELFGCFKHIGIPLDILYKMPTRDRRFYIFQHNNAANKENEYKAPKNNDMDVNRYAAIQQQNIENAASRGDSFIP